MIWLQKSLLFPDFEISFFYFLVHLPEIQSIFFEIFFSTITDDRSF